MIETKFSYRFDEHSTYLIIKNLRGLHKSAARWMVDRGVKNLILVSRFGAQSNTAIVLIKELKVKGVYVEAPLCDITKADMLKFTLDKCAVSLPPIKGVIHGSMVLKVCCCFLFNVI